jgi:hypothetical protein
MLRAEFDRQSSELPLLKALVGMTKIVTLNVRMKEALLFL